MIVMTGASGGIGQQLLKRLSEREKVIGIVYQSNLDPLPNTIIERVNLLSETEVKAFADKYDNSLEHITVVHLAAYKSDNLLVNCTQEQVNKTFGINVFASIALVQSLLPAMIDQRWGRIIHVSSIVGQSGGVGAGVYSASKSALIGYSKSLAQEYGRFGIMSNIISLGYFEDGLSRRLSKNQVDEYMSKGALKRLGTTSDIIAAIEFIQNCEYFTGETINLHGGR